MKTSELTGAALDWAVAKCEGYFDKNQSHKYDGTWIDGAAFLRMHKAEGHGVHWTHSSTDWAEGGPIIEREKIGVVPCGDHWNAGINDQELEHQPWEGSTPLIAAMRCYVASKLGAEVELPKEML